MLYYVLKNVSYPEQMTQEGSFILGFPWLVQQIDAEYSLMHQCSYWAGQNDYFMNFSCEDKVYP